MAGTKVLPNAAVSATAAPEIPPKNMLVRILTWAIPPRINPTRESAKSTIAWAIPLRTIKLPASMKRGTAKRIKESAALTMRWMTSTSGNPFQSSAIREAIAKLKATGIWIIRSNKKVTNSTVAMRLFPSLSRRPIIHLLLSAKQLFILRNQPYFPCKKKTIDLLIR